MLFVKYGYEWNIFFDYMFFVGDMNNGIFVWVEVEYKIRFLCL